MVCRWLDRLGHLFSSADFGSHPAEKGSTAARKGGFCAVADSTESKAFPAETGIERALHNWFKRSLRAFWGTHESETNVPPTGQIPNCLIRRGREVLRTNTKHTSRGHVVP